MLPRNFVPKKPAMMDPINGARGIKINREGFKVDVIMFSIE